MLCLPVARAARAAGAHLAVKSSAGNLDWRQLGDRVARLGAALLGLGLQRGDRVAVLGGNSQRYLECYYALPWIGAVIVPLNNRHTVAEHLSCVADCGARAILFDGEFAAVVAKLPQDAPALEFLVQLDEQTGPGPALCYESLLRAARPVPPENLDSGALAGIFYTGGTTGRPKGVMLSHGNLSTNALNCLLEFQHTAQTVYLHAAPMFHLADGASNYALAMAAAAHVFIRTFDPAAVLEAVETMGVTCLVLVPTLLQRIFDHPDAARRDLSRLETIVYGAAPMPEAILRKVMRRLPGCGFLQAYGMTELSPIATILPREYHVLDGPLSGKLRAAGRPTYTVEAQVVAPDGSELPAGTVGEVRVRGPTVMLGYWNQPATTSAAVRAGWMHTGDVGWMDADGFIYIEDRLKDMIISGGEKVYSAEVENVMCAHPAVAQCAVIGVPSETWGEAVHAVVVLHPGRRVEGRELIRHCRERIADYKCPKSVALRSEPLPLTATGKVRKAELRQPFWEGSARRVN